MVIAGDAGRIGIAVHLDPRVLDPGRIVSRFLDDLPSTVGERRLVPVKEHQSDGGRPSLPPSLVITAEPWNRLDQPRIIVRREPALPSRLRPEQWHPPRPELRLQPGSQHTPATAAGAPHPAPPTVAAL